MVKYSLSSSLMKHPVYYLLTDSTPLYILWFSGNNNQVKFIADPQDITTIITPPDSVRKTVLVAIGAARVTKCPALFQLLHPFS